MPSRRADLNFPRRNCACEGERRCLYHEDVIREHQAMYLALRDISLGVLNAGDDPGLRAERALLDVRHRQ